MQPTRNTTPPLMARDGGGFHDFEPFVLEQSGRGFVSQIVQMRDTEKLRVGLNAVAPAFVDGRCTRTLAGACKRRGERAGPFFEHATTRVVPGRRRLRRSVALRRRLCALDCAIQFLYTTALTATVTRCGGRNTARES